MSELRIEWARGYVTTLTGVQANQRITVVAPQAADFNADGSIGASDIDALTDAWGPTTLETLRFDLDNDGVVGERDLARALGAWNKR